MRCSKKTCAALLAFLILAVPTVACSQKSGTQGQQGANSTVQASRGGSSSRTVIVGKVTAVVGNQVTLAVGNLSRGGNGGFRSQSGGTSSSSAAVSTGSASSSTSGSSSSSLITLTGETKTLLIPVGLTLSNGRSGARTGSGQRSGSSGSASGGFGGEMPQGGSGQQTAGGQSGGSFSGNRTGGSLSGGSGSRSGASTRSSGSGGTTGAGTLTQQRSSDFSSITTGMILQIVEETLSDGTQGVVSVSELSK